MLTRAREDMTWRSLTHFRNRSRLTCERVENEARRTQGSSPNTSVNL